MLVRVRDESQAWVCPALSYFQWAAWTRELPLNRTLNCDSNSLRGDVLGGQSQAGKQVVGPSKEKVLLHNTSKSKLMKCRNGWAYSLGKKTVLAWFLGAFACWVLVRNHGFLLLWCNFEWDVQTLSPLRNLNIQHQLWTLYLQLNLT